ncbi:ABC transporter permease [Streptomyces sp. B29(2018)]|uniref:ABC transporter permease n=1 Tax=Streptomyces sp. B29(2018) TaxID=2485016 RepID=UPI000FD629DA|nr:ABC transporter permease [Streptomyces sp. B29(2018)]
MDPSTSAPPDGGTVEASPAGPPQEDRKARIARYVALFAMPFLMVTMMYATYVGTMHAPAPRDLPVAVVGAGPAAERLVAGLDAAPGGTVDARLVATEDEAVGLLKDREIAGALLPPAEAGGAATIYTANAAGASQASTVQQVLAPVAVENEWRTSVEDVAPLADGDMSGTAVLFAGMGMMLAGYVPLSLMTMSLPYLLRLRRFLPLALGWSAVTSTVIWTILGPVVGAVDGHYLQFLGIGMLATGAVALTQLLFTKLVGPLAVLFGMLLWVVFGMPSSGLSLSIHTMPGFFQFLHGVLPLPAAGEALRSLLYFDGRGLGSHLLTLAVWALAALALCLLKERRSGHAIPAAPAVDGPGEPLPALAGGPVRAPRTRYVAAVLFPLSILVAVVGLMGASMHKPEVRDMPVAVVGATEQQARQAVAGLEPSLGAMFDLRPVDSVREATAQLTDQEVAGAYVLPTAPGGGAELLTASAAGPSQQTILRSVFQQVAEKQEMVLATTDVRPLTGDDTMGSNSLYVAMSWIMAGFLIMAVLRGGAPELRRFRQFLPLLAGWAVGMAVWLWFLFDVLIGAVNGHAGVLIGAGAATIFCVALAAGAFTRTIGLAAIVPVMIVLMLLGVPASGGGLPISMVPDIFRTLQDVLPLPAAVDIARSLVYFDSTGLGGNLLTIAAWGGAGLVLNLLADLWLAHRARQGKGIPAEVPRAGAPGKAERADAEEQREDAALAGSAAAS